MKCLACPREAGRHRFCPRCAEAFHADDRKELKVSLVCECANSAPVRLTGIWAAIHAYQCARCGRAVIGGGR